MSLYKPATHGRRINKNGKDESSLQFGLAVFCRFEARVGECYTTYISVLAHIPGGRQLYLDLDFVKNFSCGRSDAVVICHFL
jgi:hypothetical protein